MLSLLMAMEQGGVEEVPGPLPDGKVTRHVIPMKSPPAPSVVRKVGKVLHPCCCCSQYGGNIELSICHYLPVAVSPAGTKAVIASNMS